MGTKLKLTDFPEEITSEGIKIYGETSYENQMAVLSHFLHNHPAKMNKRQKKGLNSLSSMKQHGASRKYLTPTLILTIN